MFSVSYTASFRSVPQADECPEVGGDRNKNLFLVRIWRERSVAPFFECIGYLLTLQASLDEALKLLPSQGLCVVGFFLCDPCSPRCSV